MDECVRIPTHADHLESPHPHRPREHQTCNPPLRCGQSHGRCGKRPGPVRHACDPRRRRACPRPLRQVPGNPASAAGGLEQRESLASTGPRRWPPRLSCRRNPGSLDATRVRRKGGTRVPAPAPSGCAPRRRRSSSQRGLPEPDGRGRCHGRIEVGPRGIPGAPALFRGRSRSRAGLPRSGLLGSRFRGAAPVGSNSSDPTNRAGSRQRRTRFRSPLGGADESAMVWIGLPDYSSNNRWFRRDI